MCQSGGRWKPVSSGEISRMIQPDGAIMKASPKAAAAWGMDRSGETSCWTCWKKRVPDQAAKNAMTSERDIAVVASPVERLTSMDRQIPGSAKKPAKCLVDISLPPRAGKYPKAGSRVAKQSAHNWSGKNKDGKWRCKAQHDSACGKRACYDTAFENAATCPLPMCGISWQHRSGEPIPFRGAPSSWHEAH